MTLPAASSHAESAPADEANFADPRVRAAVGRAHDVSAVDVTDTPVIFDDVYRRLQSALARPEAT